MCWDHLWLRQTVLDVSDERQRTVVHTENAMSEVKEEEDAAVKRFWMFVFFLHCQAYCLAEKMQDTPHTFMVKFRRKGPLSIDKTDIHNAQGSATDVFFACQQMGFSIFQTGCMP